eukprot:6031136-Amphidinium_carterae.1
MLVGVRFAGERHLHCGIPLLVGGIAFATIPLIAPRSPVIGLVNVVLAVTGCYAMQPPMWSWCRTWLQNDETSTAIAAASTAVINTMGNVGGLVGPTVVGLLAKPEEGSGATDSEGVASEIVGHSLSMHLLGSCAVVGGVMLLVFRPHSFNELAAEECMDYPDSTALKGTQT